MNKNRLREAYVSRFLTILENLNIKNKTMTFPASFGNWSGMARGPRVPEKCPKTVFGVWVGALGWPGRTQWRVTWVEKSVRW